MVLVQVKADNTCTNLVTEVHLIVYSLYRAKDITEKVYNNIMNSMQISHKVDTIFMNLKNYKTYYHHWLILNPSDKMNLNSSDESVALSNLSI